MNTKCNLRQPVYWLVGTISLLLLGAPAARAVNLVQDFYLPMPEQQIYQANNSIISGTGSTIASTFSIVVTGSGTVIYYDQWEDGYETDLSNPTQPTTQVWGDGNDANGVPPGFAHDPAGLPTGTVITLTNNVALPRNPSTFLWDARDHIAATKALVVSRAAWPIPTGPVFAGAVGVLSTLDYGTNYISPVGQDLTANLFKYVGMFIMAGQNNTAVTIDPNGNGVGVTNIVLNQGESYLVNGGIKKGGRIKSTKPVQADIIIGHVGASYASDWFTLYPVEEWSSSYYTPVGSAASGSQPAYVYLYNPNTNAITINYNTRSGSGSFSVPGTNGVFQFQMPVSSGASFTSAGGQNFFAVCTVAANNSADTAYNWGFTLVPQGALTTEADVGWGPGSADGTVDGSPVWVTTLANTTVYVDYKGDHAGPLTYTNGGNIQNYDTNFTMTALQSLKIFDPSKNQTGMRVFTVDGTLITAAWGEDPDTAQPGNPYIDAGTTVLPFPVPLLKKSAIIVTDAPPVGLSVGDTVQYTVEVDNRGLLPLGNTLVIDAPSTNLTYLTNSTTFNGSPIPDSLTGTPYPLDAPGYTIPIILRGGTSIFQYLYKVNSGGAVSNSVNIGGTPIIVNTFIAPPPAGGASVSLNFTDTNGVPVSLYSAGTNVYVTMTNAVGNTSSNTVQTISVTVVDLTSLDLQTITLTETGTNSGVFRNIAGLPTSTTSGLTSQDGILHVAPGDTLSVSYTDPNFGDSATNTAAILVPSPNKQLYFTANGTPGNQLMNRKNPAATAGHGTTYTSIDIGSGGGNGAIALDNTTSTNSTANTTVLNVRHTTAGGANYMLVTVAVFTFNADDPVLTVVYSNSVGKSAQALTRLSSVLSGASNQGARTEIWGLSNPSTTNTFVSVTLTSSRGCNAGVTTFSGVNTGSPTGNAVSNSATSGTSSSVSVATTVGQYVVAVAAAVGTPTPAPTLSGIGSGQISLWTGSAVGGDDGVTSCSISNAVKSTTTTMSATWSGTLNGWAICAVSLNAAAGGGGGPATNVTSFAQTPAFVLPFTMPAGGSVTITNFITVTNGSLVANHNVTAILKTNGVAFLTLTNPVYTEVAGVNTNLVWTSTLATNITVAAGTNITYFISNGVSGTAFHVNYDSTNLVSVIVLPATTVIQVNTLGVYDAPYPGGNLVTAPVAGSTLYIRANVSDPFGNYDITSLRLAVIGPSPGASFTNILTGANVVDTNSTSEFYEYQWLTGPTVGSYNIAATANEGSEGVSASAAASISTIFLDLGTPSTTEFTAGANGIATNSYPANNPVSVRVTDLNRNTNSVTIDAVLATVTSSAGDLETLTLIETGPNTGIFTNSINASASVVGTTNNGNLYAPVGSILTANYSDPTDPSDNTSATATIQPPPGVPGVVMSKTVVSPSGGQVGTNQPVTYNLQVINTGSTTLTNVVVTDNFPASQLSYTTATPPPGTVVSGVLTWANVGPLTPGQSTNISVTFTTLAITGTATNSATANGVTATNSSVASVFVSRSALSVNKILLSPTNTPVAVGSNVVFRITVQNVGNTVIPMLPLEDNFSGAYFQFVSATIPPNGSGAGSLLWTNLASPTPLAINAVITNDITMKVVGQGNPANNTAVADFAVDSFGNSVPAASGSTNVVTAAASITGHVYDDEDQSGVFNPADPGIAGVTLDLYTDPNGDGNPSDGALVQVTTTDAGGYYEFLNLNVGHYVIVENHLPGYDSTAPSSNQEAVNVIALAASTNHNFFDYQPAASLYSTINGTVWNDLNGNGTNNPGETGLANVEVDLFQDVNTNLVVVPGDPMMLSALTDTNGNYTIFGVTPGHYIIRETVPYGYYTTGDSQGRTDSQLVFAPTNGVVTTNNNFYNRLSPIAVNDTNSAFYLVPVAIYPLTNDISPNGDALTISNAISTNGIVVINPGRTNLTFTPTNVGVTTIIYTNADAHGGTSTAVITVNVTALADLALGKSAAASVLALSNLTYTISVTNLGPSGADSVIVTDAVPSGATFVAASGNGANNSGVVTWNLGTLANGATSNLTLTVTAPANGSLTNVASIVSPTADPNSTDNTNPPVITTITGIADIGIGKSGAGLVSATSNLTYTISVTNFGPSLAGGVMVTDTLPAGVIFVNASGNGANNSGVVTWNLGNLAGSAVSNVTLTVTAPANGSLTNVASAGSPLIDPALANNTSQPVTTTISAIADLGLGKSAPASVLATSNLTYTISVTNLGPSTAGGVVVTDSVPAGATFVSATGGGVNNSGIVNWNLGNLANGAFSNVTLTVTAPANGSLTNVASVRSPTADPNSTNNVTPPVITSVTPVTDLAIAKTGPANVLAASNFSYTISVTNLGPSVASGVVVTDTLPAGVTFVSASGNGAANSGIVIWNLGTLAANQSSNLILTVTSPASGTLTNIASVGSPTGDPVSTNNATPPVVTSVTPVADLAVGKTGAASSALGVNFNYTISVTNLGPSSAANFSVTDSLPAGIIFVSSLPVTTTNAANQVIWTNLGSLASGATTNLNLTVQAASRAAFTNIATVGGPTLDNTPANNSSAPVVTSITNRPPVAVADIASTTRNVAVTIPVLANDSDPDGDPLTIVSVNPTNGTFSISGPNIIYTPTNAVPGTNVFSYTITDGFGGTNSAFVTVFVTNRPPVAANDSASTPENILVTVPVLANDSDPDGDALTIISVSPTNGTAVISGTNVVFTPLTNFVGTATVGYQIRDNFGGTNGALITVAVTNVPPVANPDSFAITENTTNTFNPLANDVMGTPGGALTIINVAPTNGSASIVGGTNVQFVPNLDFTGTATIGYTITDGIGGTNSSLITVTVTNIPPVANPDSYTVLENSTNTFSPLTNDLVRTPGGVLQIIGVTATNGTASISGTNVVFTPTLNFTGTATIGYTITDGIGGTNSSVITVTVLAVTDLAVSKSGPANVFAAANFNYVITVTNLGPGAAASLSVTDNLPSAVALTGTPPGATLNGSQLVWTNLGSLAANSATNLIVTVTAPVTGVSLTNVAGAGSPTSDPNPTNNTSPPVVTSVTPVADLVIVKTGPAFVLAASNINYTISVTNLGPSSASGVVVTDALPAGVTFVSASGNGATNSGAVNWTLGTLAAGQSSNLTVTVTAPAIGSLTNIANVSSPTTDTNLLNNTTPPVVTTVSLLADLTIGKSAPASVFAVSNLTYTISVTNFGPSTASSVTVTDSLPTGAVFVSATGGGVNNSGVVTWSLGDLASGAISSVTLTVTAPASGTMTNIATVGSPTGDPDPTNSITPPVLTSVTPLADLVIVKAGPANVLAASNFSYTISVTNLGPSSANGVVVTDALPAGVTFVSANGNGATNSGIVTWNLGALAANQSSNLVLTVTSPVNGSLTNIAGVSSPTGDTNLLNNVTPPVVTTVTPVADVSVVKTGPAGTIFGTNFNYTITVSNAGPSTASGILVTDTLPAGLQFVSAIPTTTTNAINQVIWNLGNFAATTGSNLTLTVISTQRGSLTNFASGGSPVFDPVPTNNAAPPVVTAVTNDPPIANPDAYAIAENTTNAFNPLLNDVLRTPGGTLAIINVNPTNGTAVIISGTNVQFVPNLNFTGTATIGYTISDGVGGTNSSLITVAVTNVPPVANPDAFSVGENTTNKFNPLLNDVVRTPGGTLTIIGVNPTNGAASIIGGTNVQFVPNLNFTGTATIGYTITDGIGGTNSSLITVTVTNNPPLANPDVFSVGENTTNTLNPLANDVLETPGGILTIINVAPTNGAASIVGGTNVQFVPNLNFIGTATIGYTITDGVGGTNSALITVTVTNIPPVANPDSFSMLENTTNRFNPLANDVVRTPGGTLTIIGVNPTNGAASIIGGTNVQFIPNLNFTGTATIGYTITDGIGGTNSSLITVTVTNAVTVPNADIQVYLSGPTNATVGDVLIFTMTVTNAGPMSATNTVAQDFVPTNLVFVSASSGGLMTNHIVTWPVFPLLASGQSTNLTINATSVASVVTNLPTSNPLNFIQTNAISFHGVLTNVASAFAVTFDPNTNNNNGTLQSEQVQTVIVPGVFSVLLLTNTYPTNVVVTNTIIPIGQGLFVVGASAWNPVTQLYEEFVTVTNMGTAVVHALRLYVGGLRSGVTLYNATGTNNGVPFVEYDPPTNPIYSNSWLYPYAATAPNMDHVSFALEFYSANGRPFTNSLSAVPIPAPAAQPVNGIQVTNVAIHISDARNPNTRYLIQFNSIPGRTYSIEYSDDLITWLVAVPSIVASSTSTLWYDVGPPVTLTAPGLSRYYMVILQP